LALLHPKALADFASAACGGASLDGEETLQVDQLLGGHTRAFGLLGVRLVGLDALLIFLLCGMRAGG
jgi:hypothetical protein